MERMEIEELKDYYKARVEPYGKSMNEIMEEVAKETKAYKQLEEENKKLKEERDFFFQQADRFRNENKKLREQIDLLNKQQ